ncbi:MAG: hypothetical protein Q8O67_06815 [Deltaproteobacteria bacterium]|nr:hypothetical protein [Deltaproteobacteria bacterium]
MLGEAREAAPPPRLGLDEIPFAGRRSTEALSADTGVEDRKIGGYHLAMWFKGVVFHAPDVVSR